MADWKIKDYEIRCYNLQNKLTPYEADEVTLNKQMRAIRKENKCDVLSAWKILKCRLEAELIRRAQESQRVNAPLC